MVFGSSEHLTPVATHPWVTAGVGTVRFGIVGGPRSDWPACLRFVRLVESLGFDSYWVTDHPERHTDLWTVLAALATQTERIRLGSLVSCIYYRPPFLLARQAADVDRWSGGRLTLGIGIGDHADEFARFGVPFPAASVRQKVLTETIEIVRGLWADEPLTYHGQHFQLDGAHIPHGPVQQPRVPIVIAGGGERVTLRQVAQYADVSNFGPHPWTGGAVSVDDVVRKLDALRRHCDAVGRPFDSVSRSYTLMPIVLAETASALATKIGPRSLTEIVAANPGFVGGTPDQIIEYFRPIIAAGIQYFLTFVGPTDEETLYLLANRVIPALLEDARSHPA